MGSCTVTCSPFIIIISVWCGCLIEGDWSLRRHLCPCCLSGVLGCSLVLSVQAMYSSSDDVVELTASNFNREVIQSDSLWLVEFYAPWWVHIDRKQTNNQTVQSKDVWSLLWLSHGLHSSSYLYWDIVLMTEGYFEDLYANLGWKDFTQSTMSDKSTQHRCIKVVKT